MDRRIRVIVLIVGVATGIGAASVQQSSDRRAIERAVLDYVDALYQVKPELVDRAVHAALAKRGFVRNADGDYRESTMSFDQLRALSTTWNAQRAVDPRTAPKQVVILDMLDQTASAKLVASWGIDYMHLAKYDGQWKVVNVLWQVAPAPRK
jgi:hypothetical protein